MSRWNWTKFRIVHGAIMAKKKSARPDDLSPKLAFAVAAGTVDVAANSTSATPIGPQTKSDA